MERLDLKTPHGHVASNQRHEKRLVVRVTMRADQMSQMLPDGRGYSGPGPHEIQIYVTDRKHLDALVDRATPAQLEEIAETVAEKTAAWCAETRQPEAMCPINFPAEYRLRFRRDLLPIVSYEVVGELDTIAADARRKDAEMHRDVAGAVGAGGGVSHAEVQRMIGEAVGKALANVAAKGGK